MKKTCVDGEGSLRPWGRPGFVGLLVLAIFISACSGNTARNAYSTIDGATNAVQAAVHAYKVHCGVPAGQDGPGTCDATEYTKAEATYMNFQTIANDAANIAQRTGQTPLQVVSSAAAAAINFFTSIGIKP